MVIEGTMMTMSSRTSRWSVADAKAHLSELMEEARKRPQTIERRGKPVVVVVSVDQYADDEARWRRFLDVCEQIREAGGGEIRVPRRTGRRSPFARA
jgi:prevent-host-death family protein